MAKNTFAFWNTIESQYYNDFHSIHWRKHVSPNTSTITNLYQWVIFLAAECSYRNMWTYKPSFITYDSQGVFKVRMLNTKFVVRIKYFALSSCPLCRILCSYRETWTAMISITTKTYIQECRSKSLHNEFVLLFLSVMSANQKYVQFL